MAMKVEARLGGESGQATIEYILLLFTILSMWAVVGAWANKFGLARKLARPITEDFARAYQFGDVRAKGFEDGAPEHHPRADDCEGCFRLFINPRF